MHSPRSQILAVVGLKGGVGKSTLASMLCAHYWAEGRSVLGVDTDPQGTLLGWRKAAIRAGKDVPPVEAVTDAELEEALPRLVRGLRPNDVVIVDTPPRLGETMRLAMLEADALLFPTTPGAPDLWALEETLEVYREAKALRPDLVARVVLNRAESTSVAKLAEVALGRLGVELAPSIRRRVAYAEAMLAGQGVTTHAPKSEASRELRRLAKHMLEARS